MELIIVPIVVGAAALIGVVIWLAIRQERQRREALRQLAEMSGWEFRADRVTPDTLEFAAFPLFSAGHSRRASNVLRFVRDGAQMTVCDYQYSVGHGKHRVTHHQTVAHVRRPSLELPPFVLSPENVLHKLGGVFGYHDIDFPDNPEFSAAYLLRSKEAEDRVRMLFTPALRLYFQQRQPLTVEAVDREIVVYRQGRRIAPEELVSFVDDASAVSREIDQASH